MNFRQRGGGGGGDGEGGDRGRGVISKTAKTAEDCWQAKDIWSQI